MILTVTLNPAVDKFYQVDNFVTGNVHRAQYLHAGAGGKGLNVSRVCKILCENVTATGFLGGIDGDFIRKQIKGMGIEDAFMQIEGQTRTCTAVYDDINRTSTEILEKGPSISMDEEAAFINNYIKIISNADIVTISGSLPNGIRDSFYGELITIARRCNKLVLLDTSGKTLKESIGFKPFLIKPNIDELKYISNTSINTKEDIIREAKKLYESGIPIVCATLGKDGCIAVCGEGIYSLVSPEVESVNTVGSGDSFLAGFAVHFSKGFSIKECLINAMACGIANTQFHETGRVSMELVEKYRNEVLIDYIA
jgi:tagatose 6-phosphate kinase